MSKLVETGIDWQRKMAEVVAKLEDGTMKHYTAKEIANCAGKALQVSKQQLEQALVQTKRPDFRIPFLDLPK